MLGCCASDGTIIQCSNVGGSTSSSFFAVLALQFLIGGHTLDACFSLAALQHRAVVQLYSRVFGRYLTVDSTLLGLCRAAKEEGKKREQQQAMIANRGLYMGGNVNGAAAGVGHVKPLGYGTYGKQGEWINIKKRDPLQSSTAGGLRIVYRGIHLLYSGFGMLQFNAVLFMRLHDKLQCTQNVLFSA